MKETILPEETTAKIISMFQQKKPKAEIARQVGVCRKKVLSVVRKMEAKQDVFNIRQYKNWLV